jgi:hypothetical protein
MVRYLLVRFAIGTAIAQSLFTGGARDRIGVYFCYSCVVVHLNVVLNFLPLDVVYLMCRFSESSPDGLFDCSLAPPGLRPGGFFFRRPNGQPHVVRC